MVEPKTGIDYCKAASVLSNLERQFALNNLNNYGLGGSPNFYVAPLRPGTTQYSDLLQTGFVPAVTNPTVVSSRRSLTFVYYSPAFSVVGDEIVGLTDIDSYGGWGDKTGSGVPYFFNGLASLLPNPPPGL